MCITLSNSVADHVHPLKASIWPPNSPDLYLSEHLWDLMVPQRSCVHGSTGLRPHFGSNVALTCWGADTGCLGVSRGVWHKGIGSGSFECCGVPAHPTDARSHQHLGNLEVRSIPYNLPGALGPQCCLGGWCTSSGTNSLFWDTASLIWEIFVLLK